jgi:hypothetical protein
LLDPQFIQEHTDLNDISEMFAGARSIFTAAYLRFVTSPLIERMAVARKPNSAWTRTIARAEQYLCACRNIVTGKIGIKQILSSATALSGSISERQYDLGDLEYFFLDRRSPAEQIARRLYRIDDERIARGRQRRWAFLAETRTTSGVACFGCHE